MRIRALGAVGLSAAAALTATALSPATATAAGTAAAASTVTAKKHTYADFNGDGYPDVVASAVEATVGTAVQAGAITVSYGSAAGISTTGTRLVTQADEGIEGDPIAGARFGQLQGHGDLDGDGFDDLLVRSDRTAEPTVYFTVLWGSKTGLSGGTRLRGLHTGAITLPYYRIAVGDTNGDGVADLLGPTLDANWDSTGFGIVRGPIARTGVITSIRHRETSSRDGNTPGTTTVADFTGDGRPDIAVVSGGWGPSKLVVYRATSSGWTPSRKLDLPTTRDMWKPPVAGDVNGDGAQDMILGWGWNLTDKQGKVYVVYGGANGFSSTLSPKLLTQSTPGVPGADEPVDAWGESVSVADADKDGYADIAIGAPRKNDLKGTVTILRGSRLGVTTKGAWTVTQATAGVPSSSEAKDRFGTALTWADGDKNGTPELYVGGPGEDYWKGRVWQLPGGRGTGATSFMVQDLGITTAGKARFGEQLLG